MKPFDTARAEAFGQQMFDTLNAAGSALMMSLGHRTGLFDAMAGQPPMTSAELAARAGLSERYVREWLGCMATANIVELDANGMHYSLPAEHAAFLTRASRPNNAAVAMQWVAVLGSAESAVAEAFRHGRGVPYSAYHRFHEVMAEESDQTTVAGLEEHILPLVPGLPERLQRGIQVMDVGCGIGRALVLLAERFPASRFLGTDSSPEAIAAAQEAARQRGLGNIHFEVRDAAALKHRNEFDLVLTFDAVHDQADPARVLANIAQALTPSGVYLMQDIKACSHVAGNRTLPMGSWIYAISCMHCMSVSLASGGAGLGAAWGRELAERMLAEAGFKLHSVTELPHDPVNLYYVSTRA